ncbi:MAG: hypothetical protein WEA77_11060 [Hyphomonas sp.]|uniref:hypothetical protein n=1 Tax=Hyphomonas sp. TaxID=87 RepID=UPI0034A08141
MDTGALGNILVVTHGPGRGRSVPTGRAFLTRLETRAPELAARLQFHQTGKAAPSLSGIGLVVFWLGDPLRQKYPECYRDAVDIARSAARRGIAVLNSPDALSNTAKATQSAIWQPAGIPSAPVRCVRSGEELLTAFSELAGPSLLRGDDTHAERAIRVLSDQADADRAARELRAPAALVRIHDVRSEFRAAGADPSSLFCRFHHKARAFVFRGEVKASHLFFSRDLVVGLSNCLLAREARPKRRFLRSLGFRRDLFNDLIATDLTYFGADMSYKDVLVRAVAALGLDVAAVDYSIRPDGTPILWEANPYFWLPRGEESVLSAERHAVERVDASLDWLARCLWAALPKRMAS